MFSESDVTTLTIFLINQKMATAMDEAPPIDEREQTLMTQLGKNVFERTHAGIELLHNALEVKLP